MTSDANLPSFSISAIERKREQLFDQVLRDLVGVTISGDTVHRLVDAICERLPDTCQRGAVFESARLLAGRTLTSADAFKFAWRLAGNLPRLRNGLPVGEWAPQLQDEWVPVEVLAAWPGKNRQDEHGDDFLLHVLAGTPAASKVRLFWKTGAVHMVARRVGFSSRRGHYRFTTSAQLVGLRFLAKVSAAKSTTTPSLYEVACPPSLVSWNRQHVLNLRLRIGERCPRNYTHECHRCAIGYDQCAAATHYRTYTVGECNGCNKSDAVFDPEMSQLHCRNCFLAQRMKREK